MKSVQRTGLALLVAASASLSLAGGAWAAIDHIPSVDSICLHERTVLRAKDGRSIQDSTAENPVELVKVTVCDRKRAACMVQDEEVPMSLCR
jgi:hypothetical protein